MTFQYVGVEGAMMCGGVRMDPSTRAAFGSRDAQIDAALDRILFEHRAAGCTRSAWSRRCRSKFA